MTDSRIPNQQVEWFRVEVSDSRGQVVAIESEMLVGRDIGDDERRVIRKAIDHLAGFLGPESCDHVFDIDQCVKCGGVA